MYFIVTLVRYQLWYFCGILIHNVEKNYIQRTVCSIADLI